MRAHWIPWENMGHLLIHGRPCLTRTSGIVAHQLAHPSAESVPEKRAADQRASGVIRARARGRQDVIGGIVRVRNELGRAHRVIGVQPAAREQVAERSTIRRRVTGADLENSTTLQRNADDVVIHHERAPDLMKRNQVELPQGALSRPQASALVHSGRALRERQHAAPGDIAVRTKTDARVGRVGVDHLA